MSRARVLGVALLVVLSLSGGPAVVAADTTTLTVSVETRGGSAVADATIVATWDGGSTTATTANNGKAFVDVPDGERVEIVIEHPEYTRNFPYVIEDTSQVSGEVTVPVAAKSSLSLTVRDSEGPVSNARVGIRWNDRLITSQQTGDDGLVSLQTVETGTYEVTVEKPGYFVNQTTITAVNNTDTVVRIRSGSVSYEFNVTDSHFDPPKPVTGATIELGAIGTFNTSSDGLATSRLPVNSEVEMTATKPGYETVTRTLTVNESGSTVHIDLQRTPGLTISPVSDRVVVGESVVVTVRNEYGEPVQGAMVRRNGTDVTRTDKNGQAVVPLEEAGTWALDATKDGLTAPAKTVEVIDPDATTTTSTTTESTEPATKTAEPTTTGVYIPGFGVLTGLLGLLGLIGAVTLGIRRRQR